MSNYFYRLSGIYLHRYIYINKYIFIIICTYINIYLYIYISIYFYTCFYKDIRDLDILRWISNLKQNFISVIWSGRSWHDYTFEKDLFEVFR